MVPAVRHSSLSPPLSPGHWPPKGRWLSGGLVLTEWARLGFPLSETERECRGRCSPEEAWWHRRPVLATGRAGGQVHKVGTRPQGLHQPLTLVHLPLEAMLRALSPGLSLPLLSSPQPLSSFLPLGRGLITPLAKVPAPESGSASPHPGRAHSQVMQ